jgi:hypothetical protein
MPDFEVIITHKLEYTGLKCIKAKDEETALERVTVALEKANVSDLAGLEKFCDSVELTEDSIDVEGLN